MAGQTPLTYLIILASLSEILNVFWIYVIVTQSTEKMHRFRPFLLQMAVADLFSSLILTWGLQPDLLFPIPAIKVKGLLKYFDPAIGVYVATCLAGCAFVSILIAVVECCVSRAFMVYGKTQSLRYIRGKWALLYNCLIYTGGVITVIIAIPYIFLSGAELAEFAERHGLLYFLRDVDLNNDVLITLRVDDWTIIVLAIVIIFISVAYLSFIFGLSFLAHRHAHRQLNVAINCKKQRQQRHLTILFACQAFMPLMSTILPILMIGLPWVFHIPSEIEIIAAQNVATTLILGYPLTNSILSLRLVKPYRLFVQRLFCRLCCKPAPKIVPAPTTTFVGNK